MHTLQLVYGRTPGCLVLKFRDHLRKHVELPPCFVPREQPLIEIPTEPLEVGVFLQRFNLSSDVINGTDQSVLRLHHTLKGMRDRRRLTGEAISFKEAKAGEVFNKPRALGMGT